MSQACLETIPKIPDRLQSKVYLFSTKSPWVASGFFADAPSTGPMKMFPAPACEDPGETLEDYGQSMKSPEVLKMEKENSSVNPRTLILKPANAGRQRARLTMWPNPSKAWLKSESLLGQSVGSIPNIEHSSEILKEICAPLLSSGAFQRKFLKWRKSESKTASKGRC